MQVAARARRSGLLRGPGSVAGRRAVLAVVLLALSPARAEGPAFKAYFGNLHAHTSVSDGIEQPKDAYEHARTKAKIDFLCLSEHNHPLSASNTTQEGLDKCDDGVRSARAVRDRRDHPVGAGWSTPSAA
jgi:hypothetical protein